VRGRVRVRTASPDALAALAGVRTDKASGVFILDANTLGPKVLYGVGEGVEAGASGPK
jgi:hypothetical protein